MPSALSESRRRLRSTDLIVPATRCATMGHRAFVIAASRASNSLPDAIRRSPFTENSLLYSVFLLTMF